MLLLVAVLATAAASLVTTARLLPPPAPIRDRAAAASLLALALPIAEVRLLGLAHGLARGPELLVALSVALALVVLAGPRARRRARDDLAAVARALLFPSDGRVGLAPAIAGVVALGLAGAAAYLLPIFAWDALGYHLPVVWDAVQTGSFRVVPTSVVYVNAYPHAIESFFTWCRLLLADDTMLDFGQAPFGLAAVVSVAAFARRGGASVARATSFGLALLALPIVMLQLATDYVDVAYAALAILAAYFATSRLDAAEAACAGIAVGLLLATKPSAPPAAAILLATVVVRGARRRRLGAAAACCAIATAIGAPAYVANVVAHGNPVWPVAVALGPVRLSGPVDGHALFMQGLPAEAAHAGWLARVTRSWLLPPERYIYDMRLGGFGPLFACGLLPLVPTAWFRGGAARAGALVLVLASLATPAAHASRYTIALPAALLALGAAATQSWTPRLRATLDVFVAALAAAGLVVAYPGFTDGGRALTQLAREPAAERARAASVDGHPDAWIDARRRLGAGDAFAHDDALSLPGLLVREDGASRVLYLPPDVGDPARSLAWLRTERVRLVAARDGGPWSRLSSAAAGVLRPLFHCPLDPCTVYEVIVTR